VRKTFQAQAYHIPIASSCQQEPAPNRNIPVRPFGPAREGMLPWQDEGTNEKNRVIGWIG